MAVPLLRRLRSRLARFALTRRLRRTAGYLRVGGERLPAPASPTRLARLNNWVDDRLVMLAAGVPSRKVRTASTGNVGTPIYGGMIDWDHNDTLTMGAWRGDGMLIGEGRRMYLESADCFRIILEHAGPLLTAAWQVKPPKGYEDDPEALQIAGFIEDSLLGDGWYGRLFDAVLMARDGVRIAEFWHEWQPETIAYAFERPTDPDTGIESRKWRRTDTGRRGMYVPKMASRLPHTVAQWLQAEDGSLAGIVQDYPVGEGETRRGLRSTTILASDLVVWTFLQEGANFEGTSLLRPSWALQRQQRELLNLQAIGWRRWAIPTPVAKETIADVLTPQDWEDLRLSAEQWAVDANAFLTLIYGAGWDIIQGTIENAGAMDDALDRLSRTMHRAAGTEHVFSGEGYGARSLAETKLSHYLSNLELLSQAIADPLRSTMFRATLEANGWPVEKTPYLVCGSIVDEGMEAFGKGLAQLAAAGCYTPQLEDEEHVRERFGLPDLSQDTLAKLLAKNSEPDDEGEGEDEDEEADEPTEPPPIEGLATHPPGCGCGAHALAIRPEVPITHEQAMQHSAAFGALALAAQRHHQPYASRVNRRAEMESIAQGLDRLVRGVVEDFARRLEGKTVQEASKVAPTGKPALVAYLRRRYQDVLQAGRDEAAGEIRRQRADPEWPGVFAAAMEWAGVRSPQAFATVKDKAKDKRRRAENEYDRLDVDDYVAGAAATTADALLGEIDRRAQAAVQSSARSGGVTGQDLQDLLDEMIPLSKLEGLVQPDVLGVQATGRRIEQISEGVEWGWYTTTPELSSQVCEVCLDTEGRPDNGFEIGGPLEVTFPTPNPNCIGTVKGATGDRCWCQVIGLAEPPEGWTPALEGGEG